MKKWMLAIVAIFAMTMQGFCQSEAGYNLSPNNPVDTSKKSIRCVAYAAVEKDTIRVIYHSPGVRKRIIWGGLVPYGEVWVTGAHNATKLEMPRAFMVNNVRIPAGKYAIFSIPGESSWTLIINKNWEQHLADDYDPKNDIVRIQVKPENTAHLERLEYFVRVEKSKGQISMGWEKIRISLPFSLE